MDTNYKYSTPFTSVKVVLNLKEKEPGINVVLFHSIQVDETDERKLMMVMKNFFIS